MDLINRKKVGELNSSIIIKILSGRFLFGKFIIIINILSLMVSWHFNQSVGWAIFHYIFGVWNMLYNLLSYRFADGAIIDILNSYF